MDDFLLLLQFMVLPIGITLLLALVLPAAGTFLSIRNELLITLSLPSAASAVIALLALCGIPESLSWLRIALTVVVLVLLYNMILKRVTAPVIRQTTLAGLLIGSQAMTRFAVAMKPALEGEFRELLNGEMLAVSNGDLWAIILSAIIGTALIIRFFSLIRTYVLDEDSLKRFPVLLRSASWGIRALVTIWVTLGVVTIGPLLTTAFMVLPVLFGDTGKKGFTAVLLTGTVIGVIGVTIGFPVALAADLPPAYIIAVMLIPVGALYRLLLK